MRLHFALLVFFAIGVGLFGSALRLREDRRQSCLIHFSECPELEPALQARAEAERRGICSRIFFACGRGQAVPVIEGLRARGEVVEGEIFLLIPGDY